MLSSRARAVRDGKMLGTGPTEIFAQGRAPAVVAFHGFGGTAAELAPLLESVADAGYAVDGALLPGHGTRVEDLQEQTFDTWLASCRARLRAATDRHGRVVLLGFSLGSLLAMQLASERPEGLAGLVVLGNAVTLKPLMGVPFGLWTRLGRPVPDAYLLKPRPGDLADASAMPSLVTYDRHPLRAAYQVYLAGPRVQAAVPRIACPTLVMHGRRDMVCSWKNATWVADHVGTPEVSVRLFERSAHVLCCDYEREAVARETLWFLRRVETGG
jgi:carboxylesterase